MKSSRNQWLSLGSLTAIWTAIVPLGNETVFFLSVTATLFTAFAILYFGKSWIRKSDFVLGADGNPAEICAIPSWAFRTSKYAMFIAPILAALLWFAFWPKLFPTIKIVGFSGSPLFGNKQFGLHLGMFQVTTNEGNEEIAYPSLRLEAVKASGTQGVIQIVRVIAKPFEYKSGKMVAQTYPQNITAANILQAKIAKDGGTSDCRMLDDKGNVIEGAILLSDQNPHTVLHINLSGQKVGYYTVHVEIVASGSPGWTQRIIKTEKPILVHVELAEDEPLPK